MLNIPSDFCVEARSERARDLFLSGFNCCQSVVLAFEDLLPMDRFTLLSLTSGFGGGVGRLREVCGAVSGMTIMAGFLSPADDPGDLSARTANYALVQRFAASYKETFGSIVCREILEMRCASNNSASAASEASSHVSAESPEPSARTPEYYKSRPCAFSCEVAARIVAQYIKDNFTALCGEC